MRILVAAELNVDLVLQGYHKFPTLGQEVLVDDLSLTLGSASAICAAGLARLGNSVAITGKLGYDMFGGLVMKALAELGVDTTCVLRDPGIKTGITVSITSAKDRALVTYLGSIAALRADEIPDGLLAEVRHLHVSSFFLQHALRPDLKALFKRAHKLGVTTSLDPGFDPTEEWAGGLSGVLAETDVFLPNEVELEAITGSGNVEAALRSLVNGRTQTAAKLGSQGCAALADGQFVRVPAFPVTPVDTTGAGDSFNAGFLHGFLSGRGVPESLRFGAACGALSTLALGGTAAQATAEQAEEFLAAHPSRDAAAVDR